MVDQGDEEDTIVKQLTAAVASIRQWRFRAKGQAHLVYAPIWPSCPAATSATAATSTSQPGHNEAPTVPAEVQHQHQQQLLQCTVLRLSLCPPDRNPGEHNLSAQNFYRCVLPALLPARFLPPCLWISLDEVTFRHLKDLYYEQHGQACPPALLSATLMPDLTRLPSHWPSWAHRLCPRETLVAPAATGSPPWSAFAIELKPKCGVWSLRDPVSQQVIPACAFSLQQRIKRPNPSLRSTYCPLALFSSQLNPVRNSLRALMANPQNNFSLWLPQGPNGIETQIDLSQLSTATVDYLVDATASAVLSSDILQAVLPLQDCCPLQPDAALQLLQTNDAVDDASLFADSAANAAWLAARRGSADLRDYVTMTTLRDCSILIAVEHTPDGVLAAPYLIDLEPKSLGKISHHVLRDEMLLVEYAAAGRELCLHCAQISGQ